MHTGYKLFAGLLIFIFPGPVIFSQPLKRLSHISYNVNEGLLQSQVYEMAEDGNGFTWISSGGGVQRFDGRNFHHIPAITTGNGIPDDRYVRFFRLQNGNLWLSHQKGITEYDIITNRFRTIKEINPVPDMQHRAVAEVKDGVWYWFSQKGFYKISKGSNQFSDSLVSTYQKLFNLASGSPVFTGRYFIQFGVEALLVTDLITGRANLVSSPAGKRHFFAIENYATDTVLVATARGVEKLDCRIGTLIPVHAYKTNPSLVNNLHPVQLKLISPVSCLVSEGNKLFELDLLNGNYSAQLINLQNQDFTEVGYITGLFSDSHNNLWIISENDGIKKVNYHFAGFRYFGTASRRTNYVKAIYADKKDDRVLCGTFGEGMLIFDTTQHLLKEIRQFPGVNGPVTVCGFIRRAPHRYLVIAMGTWDVYILNTLDFSIRKMNSVSGPGQKEPDDHAPDYHLSIWPVSDSVSIIQSGYHIYKMNLLSQGQIKIRVTKTFSMASVSSRLINDRLWIGSYGRFYISEQGYAGFREIMLPENKLVRCFAANEKKQVWMGTEKGLYLLDSSGTIIKLFTKADGLPDENIYAARIDKNNNLWLSHNKGISCMKPGGGFLHFSKNDGLQENEFNTNTSFETPDGELFFGGVNGISSFYPNAVTGMEENVNVLISHMQIKDVDWNDDTAFWNIRKIDLPYYSNQVSIDLSAFGNRTPEQYNYQYQVSGQDAEWVNAGNNAQVRLALEPGKHVFRYYAGNSFEKKPVKAKELIIIISPPFWKTGWFIAGLILVLAVSTVFITRYISQAKLKRQVEELERKRTLYEERIRISREMHDDIGAGLTQITLMSERAKQGMHKEEPLNEIAEASRKLVGSMNEIIWSLNPENNTLEQMLSYLREQLNRLLEYSGIGYDIKFPQNGTDIILNNSQRRNLLLVTKEIAHNAIKHSKAKNIIIECTLADNQLSFVVKDDGKGFDTNTKSQGHGLRNISRRIEELNGTLQITSSEQHGSRFSYNIPLA